LFKLPDAQKRRKAAQLHCWNRQLYASLKPQPLIRAIPCATGHHVSNGRGDGGDIGAAQRTVNLQICESAGQIEIFGQPADIPESPPALNGSFTKLGYPTVIQIFNRGPVNRGNSIFKL
jgi:hypothetical protein